VTRMVVPPQRRPRLPVSPQFLFFAAFVIIVGLMGGGARSDILSLAILRPLAIVAAAYAFLATPAGAWHSSRVPLSLLAAAMAITALQLVPLPAGLWTSLAGRDMFAQVYAEFAKPEGWHALNLYPSYGWNSLFAMFVPLAALLLLIRVDAANRPAVLILFIGLAVASATLGILQLLGPSRNLFYLYRITNFGDPVGLFSNRNHQAVFLACAFPIMAAYVGLPRERGDKGSGLRTMLCCGAAVFLLASVVATGSRSGTLIAAAAIVASFALVPRSQWTMISIGRKRRVSARTIAIAGVAIISMVLLFFSSRLTSLQRFVDLGGQDDIRVSALSTNLAMAREFFPWGAGMGTFAEVFAIHEPAELLDTQYLNHAHNDWVEIVIEGGLPAILLVIAAIALIVRRAIPVVTKRIDGSQTAILSRLGLVLLLLLAMASVSDYPLRTPTMSVLAVVALYWLFVAEHRVGAASRRESPMRNASSNGF